MPAGGKGEGTCIVHASGEGEVWPAIGWLCDNAGAGSLSFGLIGTLVKDQFDHGQLFFFWVLDNKRVQ